jgi:glycosyltransferase involved in cell wall biosynthesis
MIKISGIQTISNAVSLGYPFIEAALSILPIVNEVLINDGGSEDETPFYLEKLKKTFPEKIRLFNKSYHRCDFWQSMDECINYLIDQAEGDWILEICGDEIWHEKTILEVKKTIEKASKEGYNSIRTIVHWCNFQEINPYKYRNVRIVRKMNGLKNYNGADDFYIGRLNEPAKGFTSSNVPPELVTDFTWFNLGGYGNTFPENDLKRAETIATFFAKEDKERQQAWESLKANPPQKQEPNPETVRQLPALVQGLAGLDKYRVREELFDKKFLKKLTGLNYK